MRTSRPLAPVAAAACAAAVLFAGPPVAADPPTPTADVGDWLEMPRVDANATLDGKPVKVPVFAGRNFDKEIYAIVLKGELTGTLCVETTTSFIGRFPESDVLVKGKVIRVDPASVPPAAEDLDLGVTPTKSGGYELAIRHGKTTLICDVPAPDSHYQLLLKRQPVKPKMTPTRKAILAFHGRTLTAMQEADDRADDPADDRDFAPPPPPDPGDDPLPEPQREIKRQHQIRVHDQLSKGPQAITPDGGIEAAGSKSWYPPFSASGTESNKHSSWVATGFAQKHTGVMFAMTDGQHFGDSKHRGEFIAWVSETWTAPGSGKVSVNARFVDLAAGGVNWDPSTSGASRQISTSTAYLWIGVRNERTQDDDWEDFSLGRSPLPFAALMPTKMVTLDSDVEVAAGDQVTLLIGVCDYSSAKHGGTAHGNIKAQLTKIKANTR